MAFFMIIVGLLIALASLLLYFLPSHIAYSRNRQNKGLIFFLNIFLGWTVFVWLILFIWSIIDEEKY